MVAVNKIDKEGADPNRVRGELAQHELTPADWGGDTEFVDVSAKTKQNLEELLETLVTLAEIQELKANRTRRPRAWSSSRGSTRAAGSVVTLLIQRGELKVGDALVAGEHAAAPARCTTSAASASSRPRPACRSRSSASTACPRRGEHFRVVGNEREAPPRGRAGQQA